MFLGILLSWFLFYLFRKILSLTSFGTLLKDYLDKLGFSCSLFHILYETDKWNAPLYELFNQSEKYKRRFLSSWFDIGIFVMFLGQILSIITLTVTLFYSTNSLWRLLTTANSTSDNYMEHSPSNSPIITPVIPGINFPLKYLFDFWICTFLVIFFHEFGHAAAASMERLQIQGLGIFFLFIFPGAYVRIEESIQYLPMYPQLRVYSAGVWHNVVMALICMISLFCLPNILSIGYISLDHSIPVVSNSFLTWEPVSSSPSHGVVITQILANTPLSHSMKIGDILVSINDIPIPSSRDFQRFILFYYLHSRLSRVLTHISHHLENSLLTQTEIEYLKDRNTSQNMAYSSSPGRYFQESYAGYVVKGNGVCVSEQMILKHRDTSRQCCKQVFFPNNFNQISDSWYSFPPNSDSNESEMTDYTNTCYFLSHNMSTTTLTDQPTLSPPSQIYCMPARDVQTPPDYSGLSSQSSLDSSKSSSVPRVKATKCHLNSDCSSIKGECLHPLTSYPTTLITLGILSPYIPLASTTSTMYHYHEVLYEGTPQEILQTLTVGSYRLRRWLNIVSDYSGSHDGYTSQSSLYQFLHQFPDTIILYLWLCIQLNVSVAILNMLPVSILDGGLTSPQFARLLFPRNWELISKVTEYYGYFLLGGNLLLGLIPLIIKLIT